MSAGAAPGAASGQRRFSIGRVLWLIAFIFVMATVIFVAAVYMAL